MTPHAVILCAAAWACAGTTSKEQALTASERLASAEFASSGSVQAQPEMNGAREPADIREAFSELPVPGFLNAVFYTPPGSGVHPLVVASHGAGGAPRDECEYWLKLTRQQAFLLCLRGVPFGKAHPTAFFYRNHLELGRELKAALEAAKARQGRRFAQKSGIYAGFSQGAIMAVGMIPPFGSDLPYLVLIEGGYQYWSVAHARQFAKAGGKRVLIACGTEVCAKRGAEAVVWLRQGGLEARMAYAEGAGHTPFGQVEEEVARALPWVVNGAGWSGHAFTRP
ncbi:MAG: hypothetical protein SFV15_10575 [Polyangiaceae bacterium]|nr:hypothetical protein [Polyangiaceae bacterium]